MQFREAQVTDIPQMMEIRNSVKENQLSDPALISFDDYSTFTISIALSGEEEA